MVGLVVFIIEIVIILMPMVGTVAISSYHH